MEKTLVDMLRELQTFELKSIHFTRQRGNGLDSPWWAIDYINTAGGEQFCFRQVDPLMGKGSGIYFREIHEAVEYARDIVHRFLTKERNFKLKGFDPFDYDWYGIGYEDTEL